MRLELDALPADAALLSGDDVDCIGEDDSSSSNVVAVLADALVVLRDGSGVDATDASQKEVV